MTKLPNYQCPRCGHETDRKSDMKKHFENRKKPCPACLNVIELTPEIKAFVLENRIHKVVPILEMQTGNPNVVNNIVNQYNIFQNLLTRMDPIDKITEYVKQKDIQLLDFETCIEESYAENITGLQTATLPKYTLRQKQLYDIVDSVTCCTDISTLNLIYDEKTNQIKVLHEGQWNSYPFESGVETVMETIKRAYLDYYEYYLMKKYYRTGCPRERQYFLEFIEEYFKFINVFDMKPCFIGATDGEILDTSSTSHSLEERFYPVYRSIVDNKKPGDVRTTKSRVHQVIKANSKANIVELNRQLLDLLKMDDTFKQSILSRLAL